MHAGAGGKGVASPLVDPFLQQVLLLSCADVVSESVTDITSEMTASENETKTRGTRHQGAARVVGEGTYVIAKGGSKGSTHLGYKLLIPATLGEAQGTFKIKKAGSFVISVKVSRAHLSGEGGRERFGIVRMEL